MPHRRVVIYHKNSNQALAFLPFAPVASGLTGSDIPCRPMSSPPTDAEYDTLVRLAMTFCLMLFEHSSRGYFLGSVTVAPRPLRTFLDMLILPLFFSAHTV